MGRLKGRDHITIWLAVGGLMCLAINSTSTIGLLCLAASILRATSKDTK